MYVLAIDTSSPAVAVEVVELDGGGFADEFGMHGVARQAPVNARGHGELLAPTIAGCLDQAGLTPRDIGAVVAGIGPGPYTGLRVGLMTAAAFADALSIPTYGICSLDAIAGRYVGSEHGLLVATDARRREVYWAWYRNGSRVRGPEVAAPADVPTDGVTAMTGAGARMYRELLGLPLFTQDYPIPGVLVRHARERIRDRAPSEPLVPLYLRHPDATVPAAPKTVSQTR